MRDTRRYLGLELAGAKNNKTALAALEYFPKEKKIFLLDVLDRLPPPSPSLAKVGMTGDDVLLGILREHSEGAQRLGVNVPLELPPCLTCDRKTCVSAGKCSLTSVRWMRETTRKARKSRNPEIKVLEFTPYTQRPVELWVRYEILPKLPPFARFEIDETLGGNKAPLAARMQYLRRHLGDVALCEVWPKLSVALLATELGLSKRTLATYRHLEEGAHSRELILEALSEKHSLFIYERDLRRAAQSLPAFDALICAYTALLADLGHSQKMPAGFPAASGWVEYPEIK